MTAQLRKKDVSPAARRAERKLKRRLRRWFPDLTKEDVDALADRLRPAVAAAAGDGTTAGRIAAMEALPGLPDEIAAALAEIGDRAASED